MFGDDFVGVDEQRFIAAWVDNALTLVESLERSTAHA
jgi:hypothetical protein